MTSLDGPERPAPPPLARLLADYLRDEAARPFAWGVSDCATFGMGWAERLSGRRPPNERAVPRSARAFARRQRTLPLADEVGRWLTPLGFRPVPPETAALGDIGVVPEGPTVVIRGAGGWLSRARHGLARSASPPLAVWRFDGAPPIAAQAGP